MDRRATSSGNRSSTPEADTEHLRRRRPIIWETSTCRLTPTASLLGPNAGGYDGLLVKYSDAGDLLWSRQFGSAGTDYAFEVAADAFGNVYTSGQTNGSLGGPNAGDQDTFWPSTMPPGTCCGFDNWAPAATKQAPACWVDPLGNVYRAMPTAVRWAGPHWADMISSWSNTTPREICCGPPSWAPAATNALRRNLGGRPRETFTSPARTTGSCGAPNAGGLGCRADQVVAAGRLRPAAVRLESIGAGAALAISADDVSVSTAPAEKSKRIAETSIDPSAISRRTNLQTSNLNLLAAATLANSANDKESNGDYASTTASTGAIDAAFATLENDRLAKNRC